MQVHFSVPQYPSFRAAQTPAERLQFVGYLDRFEKYASTSIAAQARVALQAVADKSLKQEVDEVRKVGGDMCAAVSSIPFSQLAERVDEIAGTVCQKIEGMRESMLNARVVAAAVEPVASLVEGGRSDVASESEESDGRVGGVVGCSGVACASVSDRGKDYEKNKKKKEKRRCARGAVPVWRRGARPLVDGSGGCVSDESAAGSVRTIDTRTGVEIEAAQTLAARRVAENRKAVAEAKVAEKMAEHRLKALRDKGRTAVVDRLAAARYEQRINEARLRAQKSFSASEDSMKSLGSLGSAGELYARQAVKKSREDVAMRKYVEDQLQVAMEYLPSEAKQRIAEMPEPVFEDEFDVFGDCPSDYNEEQREAYYDDLNRRNAEHGMSWGPAPPRRELSPEELLQVEEEIRALSAH